MAEVGGVNGSRSFLRMSAGAAGGGLCTGAGAGRGVWLGARVPALA